MRPSALFLWLVSGCLVWGQIPAPNRPSTIPLTRRIPAGRNPVAVAVADFNSDGRLDFAAADSGSNAVLAFTAQQDGSFRAPAQFAVGARPVALVTGDFNQDGRIDLAVANSADGTISVLLGDGNGGFYNGSVISAGAPADAIASGDFDRDGRDDLAVVSRQDGSVTVFLGSGAGWFGAAHRVIEGADPTALAVADFDGDRRADLVVTDGRGSVCVLPGGGLDARSPTRLTVGGQPGAVVAGDFNGDGSPDLAVANRDGYDVQMFLGDGHGGFASPRQHLTLEHPLSATAADFDGDGHIDLALSHPELDEISILFGAGDGSFKVSRRLSIGAHPMGLAGRRNDGSRTELLVANASDSSVGIFAIANIGTNEVMITGGNNQKAMVSGGYFGNQYPSNLQVLLNGYCIEGCSTEHIRFQVQSGADWGCVIVPGDLSFCSTDTIYTSTTGGASLAAAAKTHAGTYSITVTHTETGNFVTFTENNYNGPPATVNNYSGPTHGAYVGQTFGYPLWAQVIDEFGNPALKDEAGANTSYLVTFTTPATEPTATFSAGSHTSTASTNSANGLAYSEIPTAGNIAGSYHVDASTPGASPADFMLSNVPFPVVTTSPPGLQISGDGTNYGSPHSFSTWAMNSLHTIGTTTPQPGTSGSQYRFIGWSDGFAQSHLVTIPYTAVTYTATFKTQYYLTISASTSSYCTVTPSSGWYDVNTVVPISVTTNTGYGFLDWTGNVASRYSYSTTVTMSSAQTVVANCTPRITIQTNPTGLKFLFNSIQYTAPTVFSMYPGQYQLSAISPQAGATGSQYVFTGWNDIPTNPRTVSAPPPAPTTYTANFKTQYLLTISATPAAGGTVTPSSNGYYDQGAAVSIRATPRPGYQFLNWTGNVANANSAQTTVTMSAAQTVTARFVATPIVVSCASLSFIHTLGGVAPPSQSCTVTDPPTGLYATATTQSGGNWLTATLNLTGAPATMVVSIVPGSLAAGTYTGNVALSASGSSPVNVPVTLTVSAGLSISPTSNSFSASAGTGSTTVTLTPASSTDTWTAVSNSSWISITSPSGGSGHGSGVAVNYGVSANTGGPRSGSFDVLNKAGYVAATFTVNQAAASCSAQTLSPTSFTFSSRAGSGTVVPTIAGCPLTAVSSAGWLSASVANGLIQFTVQANSGATRSATITVNGSMVVNVRQSAAICVYSVATHAGSSPTYGSAGGTGIIDVYTASGCALPSVSSSDTSFITVSAPQAGTPITIRYTVSASNAARNGYVTVAGQAYRITQTAAGQSFSCTANSLAAPTLRQEGLTELLGDIVLNCTGQGPNDATGDFVVTLNTTITNHLLSSDPSGETTDAVLLKDEDSGQPPSPGSNAFLGTIAAPNAVRFRSVPLTPGGFDLRITNLRGDASSAPGSVQATVSAVAPMPIALPGAQTIGQVSPGISFTTGTLIAGTLAGTKILPLIFTERQPDAFRVAQDESGYQNPALGNEAGAATGTRFLVTFSNVPTNVNLYAPTGPATDNDARLLSADENGAGGSPVLGNVTIGTSVLNGYRQILLNNGSGTATWEVIGADPGLTETTSFNLLIDNPSGASLTGMVTTWGKSLRAPSSTAPVPRFVPTGLPTGICVPGVPCLSISPGLIQAGWVTPPAQPYSPAGGRDYAAKAASLPARFDDLRLPIPVVLADTSTTDAAGDVNVNVGTDTPNVTIIGCASSDPTTCIPSGDSVSFGYRSLGVGQQPTVILFASASSSTFPADRLVQLHGMVTSANGNRDPNGAFTSNIRVPSLSVTQTASPLVVGQNPSIAVKVNNADGAGDMPAGGLIQVQYLLPTGVSPGTISGPGWTCDTADRQNPTCTYGNSLPGGQSSSTLTVNFMVNATSAATLCFQARLLLLGGFDVGIFPLDTTRTTVQTIPTTGPKVNLDGGAALSAPVTAFLTQGDHTISVATTQPESSGSQFVFTNWNDNGTASHTITVTATPATYTATFKKQYRLTISAVPAEGGTFTPATGNYFDENTAAAIEATPADGYVFFNWTGNVANATAASTTITMNAPQTVVANFTATRGITIRTDPPGRQFTVDNGAPQTAPRTLNLSPGTHTIAVATTQTGSPGTQYLFTAWNDGQPASHPIIVGLTLDTYTATFKTQHQLTTSASPANGGAVSPASGYYDKDTDVAIVATANPNFAFANWTGAVAAATNASTKVTMSGPQTVVANFVPATPISIATNPTGMQFTVDGGTVLTAPQTVYLTLGNHTIAAVTPQAVAAGIQYVFSGWNDGQPASHTIVVSGTATTYTATFTLQYRLTISASPAAGGTVTPASGSYYDSGTRVSIMATAGSGFVFSNWTGPVADANNAGTMVTMNSPVTVTANFAPAPPVLSISKSHTGNFTPGQTNAVYTLTVSNAGSGPTTGTVTVADTLPPGLSLVSMAGSGWTCAGASCTRSNALSVGSSYPSITVTVSVASNAPALVINQASVSGGGAATATASDPTSVGTGCGYSISPTTFQVSAAAGAGSIAVAATADCAWTAVADAGSFLSISSGASGSGSGTVNYAYTNNPGLTQRTAHITVTGTNYSQAFTLTQSGVSTGSRCDLNIDGGVNIADVQYVINMILGIVPMNLSADVNHDGVVNIADAQTLITYLLTGAGCQ